MAVGKLDSETLEEKGFEIVLGRLGDYEVGDYEVVSTCSVLSDSYLKVVSL